MPNFLTGKKTYLVGWIAVALGVVKFVWPEAELPGDPTQLVTTGLAAVGLRKGIKTDARA